MRCSSIGPPHRELFDQAFHVFWRNPRLLERMMSMVLPAFEYPQGMSEQRLRRRLGDAFKSGLGAEGGQQHPREVHDIREQMPWSRGALADEGWVAPACHQPGVRP